VRTRISPAAVVFPSLTVPPSTNVPLPDSMMVKSPAVS
jgi:hypothetical protein